MKNYEAMNRDTIMSYFAIIGNAVEISKTLIAIDEKDMASKMLGIADFCLNALDASPEQPKVGIEAAFDNKDEKLSFWKIRGRLGQDQKVTAKIIRQGIKDGKITSEGSHRSKKYFQV